MAISLDSIIRNNPTNNPPRIVIYGPEGMGKTSLIANAPLPIFSWTERGEGILEVDSFPFVESFADLMEHITVLYNEDHHFKTYGLDTLDWLEPVVWEEACRRNGWTDIEQPGYGKGFVAVDEVWRELFEALDALGRHKKMMIITSAHSSVKRFQDPETEAYDRYDLKLHKNASAIATEWADTVMFLNEQTSTTKDKEAFNKERVRAVASRRLLYTQKRPAAMAKNRYNLPEKIPFDKEGNYWGIIAQHIPFLLNNDFSIPEAKITEETEVTEATETDNQQE